MTLCLPEAERLTLAQRMLKNLKHKKNKTYKKTPVSYKTKIF